MNGLISTPGNRLAKVLNEKCGATAAERYLAIYQAFDLDYDLVSSLIALQGHGHWVPPTDRFIAAASERLAAVEIDETSVSVREIIEKIRESIINEALSSGLQLMPSVGSLDMARAALKVFAWVSLDPMVLHEKFEAGASDAEIARDILADFSPYHDDGDVNGDEHPSPLAERLSDLFVFHRIGGGPIEFIRRYRVNIAVSFAAAAREVIYVA